MKKFLTACLCFLLLLSVAKAQDSTYTFELTVRVAASQSSLPEAELYLPAESKWLKPASAGSFTFQRSDSLTNVILYAEGFATQTVTLRANQPLVVEMQKLSVEMETLEIQATRDGFAFTNLRAVDGTGIYAAKKSEVVQLDKIQANVATNNAREIFRGVAGLNIWENDGLGLQLAIGARGLNPNRTSNFNTRQNGYDISADALGYPESYYTPPAQALDRIEVVRGAASLQYGTQFGGLLNFVFKDGPEDKPLEIITENTIGSWNLLNSFTSIGGSGKHIRYYGFYQRRQGDGWRDNSGISQNTAYGQFTWMPSDRLKVRLEFTHMDYLAQQPGGLVDFEFQQDPQQSKRRRNWFKVDWNLGALHLDYRIDERTRINNRTFALLAERQALGELGPINRPDPLRERDLIVGKYRNIGNETRLIHQYGKDALPNTFLAGVRLYKGFTQNQQGDADAGEDPNFSFLNPNDLEEYDYDFPSENVAVFAENLLHLGKNWSLTPGLRWEYISTNSDGYYKNRVFAGGEVIFEQTFEEQQSNQRSFLLVGLGASYHPKKQWELYGNFSQNYRSINFSDITLVNPNLIIDSTLQDERGFNIDLGIRGQFAGGLGRFDASLFYLRYNNRIGLTERVVSDPVVIEKLVAFRTNIGDAGISGLELYGEADLWKVWNGNSTQLSIRPFINLSIIRGRYLSGGSAIEGNEVELVPPLVLKTGLAASWKNLEATFLYTYVQQHYSDATNAEQVSDATRGLIPTYQIMDFSLRYQWQRLGIQAGVNNLANRSYFTRRATGYPGPGIIPAEIRRWYVGLRVQIL